MAENDKKEIAKLLLGKALPSEFLRTLTKIDHIADYDTLARGCRRIAKLRKYGGHLRLCHLALQHKDGTVMTYCIDRVPDTYEEFEHLCNDYLKVHQDFFADNAPLGDNVRMKDGDRYYATIGYADTHDTKFLYYLNELTYADDYPEQNWFPEDYDEELIDDSET